MTAGSVTIPLVKAWLSGRSGAAKRPDGGGLSGARVLAAALSVFAALAVAAPGAALAQTAVKLVGNDGATLDSANFGDDSMDRAQPFTTGGGAHVLSSATVSFTDGDAGELPTFTMEIRAADANGLPGMLVGTLTNPDDLTETSGARSFTAPDTGMIVLSPNTTYFVVWNVSAQGAANRLRLSYVTSTADDTDGADGWSVGDAHYARAFDSDGAFATSSSHSPAKIEIHGYEISSDGTLSALSATDADGNALTLSPPFESAMTDYTVTVEHDATSVGVTATVNHAKASLQAAMLTRPGQAAEEVAMTDGAAAALSDLEAGDNVLTIPVRAESGTVTTYTVTVRRRVVPSSDATLSALEITDGGGPVIPSPAFSPSTHVYAATVRNTGTDIGNNVTTYATLTAETGHPAASLAVSLTKAGATAADPVTLTGRTVNLTDLPVGDNVLTITVTARDGTAQDYTVNITRLTATGTAPPVVSITGASTIGQGANLVLTSSGSDPDGGTLTYVWTATDSADTDVSATVLTGAGSSLATFNASTAGDYTVTLTVTDDEGDTASATLMVTVTPGLSASITEFVPRIVENTDLVLTGTGSDPAGGAVTYAWTAVNSAGADATLDVFSGATNAETATFRSDTPDVYTVTLTVTGSDGATATAAQTVWVLSTDPALRAVTVTGADGAALPLDPSFAPETLAYTATVEHEVTAVGVTATAEDAQATVSGSLTRAGADAAEPVSMASGSTTTLSDLAVGANVLTVTTLAEDGTARVYMVTVVRKADTTLKGLTVTDAAGFALIVTPAFSPDQSAYSVSLRNDKVAVLVTATPTGAAATLAGSLNTGAATAVAVTMTSGEAATVSGLAEGANVLTITVSATDALTRTQNYTLTLQRSTVAQSDPTLSALVLADADGAVLPLTPLFAPDQTVYTALLDHDTNAITVTATLNSDLAAFNSFGVHRSNGTIDSVSDPTSGAPATLTLIPGLNPVEIGVLSGDGKRLQVYTVTVTAKGPPTVAIDPSEPQLLRPGEALMLTAMAEDPDGEVTGYAWTAVNDASGADATAEVLTGATDGMTATFTAMTEGAWTVTVTVTDNEDRSASAMLSVTVEMVIDTSLRSKAVKKVLAATGMRMLSNVLDHVGPRMAESAPDAWLTLAGESVPLGGPGASAAAPSCGPDVFGRNECGSGLRGASGQDLFGSSAFSLAAGASGEATADAGATRWSLWGRGDVGAFQGKPTGMNYEGKTRTGWLGMDARGSHWVAGVAVSQDEVEADYDFDAGGGEMDSGRLETKLMSVYPYARWTLWKDFELRGVVGAGAGEARHLPTEEAEETSDLTMWMASLGVRRTFFPSPGVAFAARGDMSVVRMETAGGGETIDGLSARGWRGRAGLEGSRRFALAGGSLEPFAEADVRQDGGDGIDGTGFEVAGGLRFNASRLHLEARGRWLAAHSEDGAQERGLSATVRMDTDERGRGVSFALKPRWGSAVDGSGAMWRGDLPRTGAAAAEAALDAELGYAVGAGPDGLLTPFVETGMASSEDRRYRVGARYEALRALSLEVSGERRESAAVEPEHTVGLDFSLRF